MAGNNLLGECMDLLVRLVIVLETILGAKVGRRHAELNAFGACQARCDDLVAARGGTRFPVVYHSGKCGAASMQGV